MTTGDPEDRRSLADDPDFLDSLDGLDLGLSSPRHAAGAKARRPAPDAPAPRPAPAPPAPAFRTPEPPPVEPPAPEPPPPLWLLPTPVGPVPPSNPRPIQPGGGLPRHTLLDLFPPPPAAEAAAPPARFAPAPVPPVQAPPAPPTPEPYEMFYGFDERPFGSSTDPKFFYHSAAHDHAAQKLLSAIGARKGLVVITGGAGVGKTMLCRTVMEQLDRRTVTSLVDAPSLGVDDLLRTMLADFGVITREDLARGGLRTASERELVAALRDFLQSLGALQAGAVAFLDNAERLPPEVLNQVRIWCEGENDLRHLQVILIGGPGLAARLRRKDLRALDAHVAVRITLHPIAADEIDDYVAHRLAVAGAHPRVDFDADALSTIHACARGVPREINALCDRALVKAAAASAAVVDAGMVAQAADDLQLAPPESAAAALGRRLALAAVFLLLVLAGAAGAAFVFREPFGRLLQLWVQSPPR